MNRRTFLHVAAAAPLAAQTPRRRTEVAIQADRFLIDGRPTYPGRTYQGMKIEGLLMNCRTVQAIFDDANPETRAKWAYPDTGKWDPERNTREFLAALPGMAPARTSRLHGQPPGRQPRGLLQGAALGQHRHPHRRQPASPTTWPASPACWTAPTSWAWSRSSASSTSARTSVSRDEAAVRRAVANAVDWLLDTRLSQRPARDRQRNQRRRLRSRDSEASTASTS